MIHVIASIQVKSGAREAFLAAFRENIPNVKAEDGCLRYEPTVDVDSGLAVQGAPREDVVTIVEAWESLDALHAHLKAPHMTAYREQVKEMVAGVTLQVLEPTP